MCGDSTISSVTMTNVTAIALPVRPSRRRDSPPPPRCVVAKSRPRSTSADSNMAPSEQTIMITEIT